MIKKRTLMTALVLLNIIQGNVYADYLKPALTQGDNFDGLVWWHDGGLYAKDEDGEVKKLDIEKDENGHRTATANIKGDVSGIALDYSFGWQSSLMHPTDELILNFDGNVDVGYTDQNNWEGISGNGFTVGTDTFDMTIKLQNDKTLFIGLPKGATDAAFALVDYENAGKANSVNLSVLGGNIVTHYEGVYDDDNLAVFGAWTNKNGGIDPGTITINNESITATLDNDFQMGTDYLISGTELQRGTLNLNTKIFTLGSAEKRFDKGAWVYDRSLASYDVSNNLKWYVEDYGALVGSASTIEFSGSGTAVIDVASKINSGGIWLTGESKASTGENGINSLTIRGAAYGLVAQSGSSFDMKGNKLIVENVTQGIYLNDSDANYAFNTVILDNDSYVSNVKNNSELTINANYLTATSNKYGFSADGSTLNLKGGNFTVNNTDRNIWLNNKASGDVAVDELKLNDAKYSILLQNGSDISLATNYLDIKNEDITSATGIYLSEKSIADIEAGQSVINSVFAVYAKNNSEYSLKTNYGNITGQIKMVDGSNAIFSGLESEDFGSVSIKTETHDAVTAVSDIDELSKIDFKQATYINSQGDEEYHAEKQGVRTKSAIRANRNSNITLDKAAGIYGDIIAGRGVDNSNLAGGKITVNSIDYVDFKGDVLAGNTGEINFTLNNSNYEGRIDDYADATLKGIVFRPEEFDVAVTEGGTVNLTLNNSTWTAHGQSFVTSVNFGQEGGVIDLSKDENNSVTIRNLKGNGTFNMLLNSADHSVSDMLYIGKNEGIQTINIVGGITGGLENISADNPLRFATVGVDTVDDLPGVENSGISAYTRGAGLYNLEYYVDKEKYDKQDENNELYNGSGDGQGVDKPGNDFVEDALVANSQGQAVNWIITGAEKTDMSDSGETIVNMSHANYKNAVYMDRLYKRLGEARYIDGDEGMWVRLRHDRIGMKDEFRSMNTMYQIGYDKLDNKDDKGERHIGAAIDYMDGSTSYSDIYGEGETKRWGFWMYDTWLGSKGHYADYIVKFGHLYNEFDLKDKDSGEKVTGDYDNNVFSISAEYGRKKDIGNNWYFEPQAQLQLARVTDAEYKTSQDTDIYVDGINSLIGRAGFRLGKDVDERSTVYVKADILHEFLGDQRIVAGDVTGSLDKTYENKGTWYDVGFGFATAVGHDSYAYLDFEKSFGNDNDDTYQINAGLQWNF